MGHYYYSCLPEAQKSLYLTLMKFMGHPAIPCEGTLPDIHAAVKALLMDHPKLCFFEGKWGCSDGVIYPQYVLPGQAVGQLTATAEGIRQHFPGESYPQQIYAWMLDQVEYVPEAANSQNAYGALVQRQAVCKGIAKGYQLLMEAQNISCILVEGTLDGHARHIWNMVFWNGHWRHVDVTMGYPCFWFLTGAEDAWSGFMKTTAEISRTHSISQPENLPATD